MTPDIQEIKRAIDEALLRNDHIIAINISVASELVATIERQEKWISVEQELPPVELLCLIRTMEPSYVIARLGGHKDTFWQESGSMGWPIKEVTHWRPILPPAPSAEKEPTDEG